MKILMRIVVVAVLLFVLAACVSEENSAVVQETEPAEVEAAVEEDTDSADAEESMTEEHEADGDEMDAAAEDTDVAGHDEDALDADESGEMDADDEADSDEDDDLEAGHDEDSDEGDAMDDAEDDEDTDEESVEGDAMAAAGDGWGESGTTAQSACDHPYLPLRQGSTWTYDTGSGGYIWEVTDVQGDLEQAAAVFLVTIEDISFEYTWDCTEGQGISSFDFVGQGMAASLPEMTMELVRGEGAFFPPADLMVPGYSWDSNFEQTMTIVIGAGDDQIEATGTINTEQTSTVLSADPITAAGITVDGLQVEQINDIGISMDMMGTSVEQNQTLTTTYNMGWGVGIMHQTVQSEFGPAEVELVSYFVP